MFDFGTVRLNGRRSTVGLSFLSGLRDSSLHTVAQDFAFDGSARTWSKAGKNLRQRKRCNEWEREGWGGVRESKRSGADFFPE